MKETSNGKKGLSVGMIGLGAMGLPISINIVKAGFVVHGYDIVREKIDDLVEKGGLPGANPADVAQKSEVVLTSLASPEALQEVIWGKEGLLASGKKGLIVMECSTLALEDKQKAHHDLHKAGMIFLDCPISGGARAAEKDLVVYGSGSADAYQQCLPIVNAFARAHYYLGAFGSGMKMKILANLLVAIHNVSAAEVMVLGKKAGLDPEMVLNVMNNSSGRSRMLEVRGPRMVENDYDHPSMPVKTFQKDLKIIGQFASEMKCLTPLFHSCVQVYLGAMAMGLEEKDTASVCAVLEKWSGLEGC